MFERTGSIFLGLSGGDHHSREGETMKNLLEKLLTIILAVGAAVLGLITAIVPLLVFGYIAYMLFQGRW